MDYSYKLMDFPLQNCIVPDANLAVPQVRELLDYNHALAFILLDMQKMQKEMLKPAWQNVVARYLSALELAHLGKYSLEKRRQEWLAGRFAAKYAAAGVLMQGGNTPHLLHLAISTDENGRPFLAANENRLLPDISISHSTNLAAAMAVSKGRCGIDIQKVTDRVVKVRERFCTSNEAGIIQSFFNTPRDKQSSVLTKLWAAKEALRKVADRIPLPGFLELELTEIRANPFYMDSAPWKFVFLCKQKGLDANPVTENCSVAVSLVADYALALAARSATVD